MAFQVGDIVEVRKHGRATIIETEGHMQGRFRVRYHVDNSTYWVTQDRLRKMILAARRVVVAYHTAEYRQAAVHNTDTMDVCLEIGCHAGVTTHMLSKRCKWVVGVDLSSHVVQVAKQKYPDVQFEQLDGGDIAGANALALAAGHMGGYNKVFVDISGQEGHKLVARVGLGYVPSGVLTCKNHTRAPLSVLLPILSGWLTASPQAIVIVKNRALHVAVAAAEKHREQPATTVAAVTVQEPSPSPAPAQVILPLQQLHDHDTQQPPAACRRDSTGTAGDSPQQERLLLDEVYSLLLGTGGAQVDPHHLAMLHSICDQAEAYPVCFGSSAPIALDQSKADYAAAVLQSNPALAATLQQDLTRTPGASGAHRQEGVLSVEAGALLSSGVAAVLQAAKVAADTAEKEARKQAKALRRRARKAATAAPEVGLEERQELPC